MRSIDTWNEWNLHGAPRYPAEKVVQFVLRNFADRPRRTTVIMDLGCGSGANAVFLVDEGFDCHGMDISATGVRNTRARLQGRGRSANLCVGEVAAIPWPAAFFDGLICHGVLECALQDSFSPAVAEIVRVLKPAGLAFLLFATEGDFRLPDSGGAGIRPIGRSEVSDALHPVDHLLEYAWIDDYVTTYRNGSERQHDLIVTLKRNER